LKYIEDHVDLKEMNCIALGSKKFEEIGYDKADIKGFQKPRWHSKPDTFKEIMTT